MASSGFKEAWRLVDIAEGGYSNRPSDPGGPTYRGVSLRAVAKLDLNKDGILDFDIDQDGDVDAEDIKALKDHPEKIEGFFRDRYWHTVRANELAWPWSYAMFDAAILHGPEAAIVFFQRATGLTADGKIGPNTMAAFANAGQGTLVRFVHERMKLCYRLSFARGDRHGTEMFGGWSRRLLQLEAFCVEDMTKARRV